MPIQTNFGNNGVDLSNALNLTSGQIKFPATQAPSSDANTLDDYEEGTWTPTIPNSTVNYSVQWGFYTKIGNVVYIDAFIVVNTITINSSSTPIVSGLPFASAGSNRYPVLTTAWNSLNDFGRSTIIAQVSTNSTNVAAIGCSNNTSFSDLTNGIYKNGSWIKFTGAYHVA